MDIPKDTYKTIYTVQDSIFLKLIEDQFQEEGIRYTVLGNLTGASIGMGEQTIERRIQVHYRDEERAMALLKSLEDGSRTGHISDEELTKLALSAKQPEPHTAEQDSATLRSIEIRSIHPFYLGLYAGFVCLFLHLLFSILLATQGGEVGYRTFKQFNVGNIMSFALGGVFGACFAMLYNLLAGMLGGLHFEISIPSEEDKS